MKFTYDVNLVESIEYLYSSFLEVSISSSINYPLFIYTLSWIVLTDEISPIGSSS